MIDNNIVEDAEIITDSDVTLDEASTEPTAAAPSLKSLLNPCRAADEPYLDYKVRRQSANRAVKHYLNTGTVFHKSRDDEGRPSTYTKQA